MWKLIPRIDCRCIDVIFFRPKGHSVRDKYFVLLNKYFVLLNGHTYGGFVSAISERGMIISHYFLQIKPSLSFLVVSLHVIISLYMQSGNHKSTQTYLHHCLDDFEDDNQGYQRNLEGGC
jgi:hypothetical protein